jgi:hypothetical protein
MSENHEPASNTSNDGLIDRRAMIERSVGAALAATVLTILFDYMHAYRVIPLLECCP